ncbi:MAG: hypothetical protein LUG51_14505 [Tannerellaceae bacterium]|nr:hypothetical protein [Tannerellaceae bacterium]
MINLKKEAINLENEVFGDWLFTKIEHVLQHQQEVIDYRYRTYAFNSILYTYENENERVSIRGLKKEESSLLLSSLSIVEGSYQPGKNSHGIMISNGLAESLGLQCGDACYILQQTIDGMINLEEYEITATFLYTSLSNKNIIYMEYEEVKSLYNCNLPNQILIYLEDYHMANSIKEELVRELIGDSITYTTNGTEGKWLKISSYTDHLGSAQAVAKINEMGIQMIVAFLVLISFVGIWSMQSENIHKRLKESGTLLSFGFTKSAVKKIFLLESLYISFLFSAAGIFLIGVSIRFINYHEDLLLGQSASFAFGSSIINPQMEIKDLLYALILAVLYPLGAIWFSLGTLNKRNIIHLLTPSY